MNATAFPVLSSMAGVPRETIDRVRAAVINSGRRWPDGRLALTVWPPHPDTSGQTQPTWRWRPPR